MLKVNSNVLVSIYYRQPIIALLIGVGLALLLLNNKKDGNFNAFLTCYRKGRPYSDYYLQLWHVGQ